MLEAIADRMNVPLLILIIDEKRIMLMKKWRCTICNYIHEGDEPPEKCPICGAPKSKFVEVVPEPEKTTSETVTPQPKQSEKEKASFPDEPKTLKKRLEAFIIRHHLHPISVHFPNGVLPVAFLLFILSLFFCPKWFAWAGFINLVFVLLALPFVLYAGYLEWKNKYNRAMTKVFQIKILAASITTAACVLSVIWYLIDPEVMSSPLAGRFVFINIIMRVSAGIAGLIGGRLVFKD